jgi:4a-hydroxytetrahydrobiopterin dehydratase
MPHLLTAEDRAAHLPALGATGWGAVTNRDALRKVWRFRDFSEAWGFMCRTALVAEAMNHHPEWRNVYNTVDVTLTTHDCHGLSDLDLRLARAMDRLAGDASVQQNLDAPVQSLCEIRARG